MSAAAVTWCIATAGKDSTNPLWSRRGEPCVWDNISVWMSQEESICVHCAAVSATQFYPWCLHCSMVGERGEEFLFEKVLKCSTKIVDQSKNMIIKTRTNKSSRSRWLTCAKCKRIRDSWLVKEVSGIIFTQSQSQRTNWSRISSQEINNLWKWKKTMFVQFTEQPFYVFKSLYDSCVYCVTFSFSVELRR